MKIIILSLLLITLPTMVGAECIIDEYGWCQTCPPTGISLDRDSDYDITVRTLETRLKELEARLEELEKKIDFLNHIHAGATIPAFELDD